MKNYKFYESKFGRRFYVPAWLLILAVFLLSSGYFYAAEGTPRLWALPILFLGFVLFVVAKVSVIRKGHRWTAGASAAECMTRTMAALYYGGYALMLAGFLWTWQR